MAKKATQRLAMPARPDKDAMTGEAQGIATVVKATYHHKNLRSTLIESGKQLLETSGLPAFSLRMAARTAGVSQTAPYHHFADKDGLLAAIAADGFLRLAIELEEACGEGLRAIMLRFLRFARANPQMFRLMFATDPATRPAAGELKVAFDRCWAACTEATRRHLGEADGGHPRVREATLAVWSGMYGLTRLGIDAISMDASGDEESSAGAVVEIIARGLGESQAAKPAFA